MSGLAHGGRVVVLGYAAGIETTMRDRSGVEVAPRQRVLVVRRSAEQQAEAYAAFLPLIANGKIAPAHDRSFPLEQAPEALRHLIEDRPFGKVTLSVDV